MAELKKGQQVSRHRVDGVVAHCLTARQLNQLLKQ